MAELFRTQGICRMRVATSAPADDPLQAEYDPLPTDRPVAILFAGRWCRPCRAFCSKLAACYDESQLPIIVASCDRTEEVLERVALTLCRDHAMLSTAWGCGDGAAPVPVEERKQLLADCHGDWSAVERGPARWLQVTDTPRPNHGVRGHLLTVLRPGGSTQRLYGVRAIPALVVIRPDGKKYYPPSC